MAIQELTNNATPVQLLDKVNELIRAVNIGGGVVESGDGYVRYANGVQICTGTIAVPALSPISGAYSTAVFAKPFISAPNISYSRTSNNFAWSWVEATVKDLTGTQLVLNLFSNNAGETTAAQTYSYMAVGTWK